MSHHRGGGEGVGEATVTTRLNGEGRGSVEVGQTEWMTEAKMMDGGQDDKLEMEPEACDVIKWKGRDNKEVMLRRLIDVI